MARNSIDTFPARLRELREQKGLSREQVAVNAGTSSHSVAKLEQGTRAPSLELAWRIAQALGCSLDDLVAPPSTGAPPEEPKAPAKRARKPKK
jgi:transcriptional regulator with XRE-family HTH domain